MPRHLRLLRDGNYSSAAVGLMQNLNAHKKSYNQIARRIVADCAHEQKKSHFNLLLPLPRFSSLFVCRLLATFRKKFRTDLYGSFRESWQTLEQWTTDLNFGGNPDHRSIQGLFSGFVTNGRYGKWYQLSTDCAARRCRAGHALAGIAIATMTSLRHRPLAEVCTVQVFLVL